MITKVRALSVLMLFTATAQAEKRAFEFSIDSQTYVFQPSCIKSKEYEKRSEKDSGHLSLNLNDACSRKMAKITEDNMAEEMIIFYQGNPLFRSMILQRLSKNFSFSTEKTPRVVLMQIINDYDVSVK